MTSEREVVVAGKTPAEQACHLAGVLAESGVDRIVAVLGSGERVELTARGTDLPGVLATEKVKALEAVGIVVRRGPGGELRARCSEPATAERLGRERGSSDAPARTDL